MRSAAILLLLWAVAAAKIDELFRARCAASCHQRADKNKCETQCSLVTESKPGECPSAGDLSKFERACITSCTQDRDCAATEKCCVHQCGRTCQHAVRLDQYPGLPGIPSNLTVSDDRWPRSKMVRWVVSAPSASHTLYVLQERRHLGEHVQPQLFGPWHARTRRHRTKALLNDLIPAYWYEVRVAAVSSNGTRGYSSPSAPFRLTIEPSKPGEPRNLTVLRPGWVDGKLTAELHWRRPRSSDIPLHHYKVSWSHCVSDGELDNPDNYCRAKSVIVKHESVNYKSTNFILRNLEANSLYYIQVQAITVPYGLKKKLVSDKAVVFINTKEYRNATFNWRAQPERVVKKLRVSSTYQSNNHNLETKVLWDSTPGRFLVKWAPNATCKNVSNSPSYSTITEELQYDIDHLTHNCTYQVSVMAISSAKSAKITFTTPTCSQILPCV